MAAISSRYFWKKVPFIGVFEAYIGLFGAKIWGCAQLFSLDFKLLACPDPQILFVLGYSEVVFFPYESVQGHVMLIRIL